MRLTLLVLQKYERKWVLSDTNTRSLVKTVSWRLTGSGATFLISYIILGNFAIAGSIAVIQLISNTILYYIHERIWNRINWGRDSKKL
jgi:uncharacterized membrane protein